VFEYMALGKIVVAQKTPAVEEIISDKQNGFLYRDSQNLAELLTKLARLKLLDQIARAALVTIEQNTWESRQQELAAIYLKESVSKP